MPQVVNLQEAERTVFRMATQKDGLWDVLLGCFALLFALAPLLSKPLGDFWSSMVFLPFWGVVAWAIWAARRRLVVPRIGLVRLSAVHKVRLRRFARVLLVVNVLALALGLALWASPRYVGQVEMPALGLILLVMLSLAALLLDYPRLYIYGLLSLAAPLVGEWLYQEHGMPHHGLPLTFGVLAGVMILTGLVVFVRLVQGNPLPEHTSPTGKM